MSDYGRLFWIQWNTKHKNNNKNNKPLWHTSAFAIFASYQQLKKNYLIFNSRLRLSSMIIDLDLA